jgi:glucose-1-phosphate thymidylyltransferase
MPGRIFHELRALWEAREHQDEYIGTLVNAYLAAGGTAVGCKAGQAYVDVGTLDGYRAAMMMLSAPEARDARNASPETRPLVERGQELRP